MSDIEARLEITRDDAHNAPMNPLRTNHDGRRWIEPYSTAWARKAREYSKLLDELEHNKRGLTKG